MGQIFHIAGVDDWEIAQALGRYEADSLYTEGFIHCSTAAQVLGVANARFAGREDLVLLRINEECVQATVRYENTEGGTEPFPHVYGPLPCDAVDRALPFAPQADGTFRMPDNGS